MKRNNFLSKALMGKKLICIGAVILIVVVIYTVATTGATISTESFANSAKPKYCTYIAGPIRINSYISCKYNSDCTKTKINYNGTDHYANTCNDSLEENPVLNAASQASLGSFDGRANLKREPKFRPTFP